MESPKGHVTTWSSDDVCKWLNNIGLGRYSAIFKQNDISGKHLIELSKEELHVDLKIESLGHRKDIYNGIQELKAKPQEPFPPFSPTKVENKPNESNEQVVVLTRQIGKGGYGTIWLGRWKPNATSEYSECAIKIVSTADAHPERIKRVREEISILQRLNHENVVKYFGNSEKFQELHIYMEVFPFSLHQILQIKRKKLTWLTLLEIYEVALKVAQGLKYLHELENAVIHRDIKSKNILVHYSEETGFSKVALCDFGVSKVISESAMANTFKVGTFRFCAPEVAVQSQQGYSSQSDIWGYGMLLYELLTLRAPYFDIVESEEITKCIIHGIPPHIPPNVPSKTHSFFIKLMHQCLQLTPSIRPTGGHLVSQLTQAASTIKKLSAEAMTAEDIDSTINEYAEKNTAATSMLRSSSATGLGIAPQYQTSWAVIIGIDEYQSNELSSIKYAVNNASNIEAALRATGFQTIVLLNKDATKEAIEEILGDTLKWKVSINDRVLVFFSCHWRSMVTSNGDEEIYLLPYNCKPSKMFSTGISLDRLKSYTKQIPVRHLLFLVDACVSKRARIQLESALLNTSTVEPVESAVLDDIMQHSAVQIITAGFKGQQNHTIQNDTQTIFSQLLVEGIEGKAFYSADLRERDWITTDELSSWLQRRVSERTLETQFPQYERLDFGTRGSFVFSNPNYLQKNSQEEEEEEMFLEDEDIESADMIPISVESKPIQIVVVFVAPLIQEHFQDLMVSNYKMKKPVQLENTIVELGIERSSLLSTFKSTSTALQVRIEFAKSHNDLKKLVSIDQTGILHLSDYNSETRDPQNIDVEEGEVAPPNPNGCFALEDELGQLSLVTEELLVELLEGSSPLHLVIINSKNARKIGSALVKAGVKHVVGITKNSLEFENYFYNSLLCDNCSVVKSFEIARSKFEPQYHHNFFHATNPQVSAEDQVWPSLPSGKLEFLNPPMRTSLPKVGDFFVGRNTEVKSVLRALIHQRIVSVTGGPGVGKTAVCLVATNFLNDCRFFCDGVFFVDLRNLQPTAVPYRIGSVFGLNINSEEELFSDLTDRECLILLDNCDHLVYHEKNLEFRRFLCDLLKNTKYCKVLLTSRQELDISINNEVVFQPFTIKVTELEPQESTYLLSKIAPSLGIYAERVGELFGHLPLAIHAAKMFVNQEIVKRTPEETVHMLEKQVKEMKSFDEFDQLVNLSIESSYSVLPIELQQFLLTISVFPSTFDVQAAAFLFDILASDCKDILRKLLSYNLIEVEQQNRFHLHGLIRMFLTKKKKIFGEDVVNKWNARFIDYYLKYLESVNYDYLLGNEAGLRLFDVERHNIEAAMQMAEEQSDDLFSSFALAGEHIFCARISPVDRITIYDKCVNTAKRNKNEVYLATFLCSLAYAFERTGEYARSEAMYLESLKIRDSVLGPEHPDVADVMKNLALLYSKSLYKQDYEQAGKLFKKALEIREKVLGNDHPETGKLLSLLATYKRGQQQYTEAEILYERALRVLKDLGTDNIYVARVLNNQGQLYMMTNRDRDSEIKFLQAIRITRKLAHPDRAQPLSNLGTLYRKQKKYVQAEMLFKEAVQVREQTKENFSCGTLYYKLAVNSRDQKNYDEAEFYFKKALEIYDIFLGRSHELFGKNLQELEAMYRQQNKNFEADELLKRWGVTKKIHTSRRASFSPTLGSNRVRSGSSERPFKRTKSEEIELFEDDNT